jgi:hypothetical protein
MQPDPKPTIIALNAWVCETKIPNRGGIFLSKLKIDSFIRDAYF